ncbi:predicted protein [Postia placenta Mad-698-R]|uniref:RlpA-like protein double-psi beta-barrel domain-containing protein n=2 Tax=Rhodonia placenta TaxID=104341 RepID=A0A1X6MUD8_9APHY|nr:hypothetical protein POSPLADRAFT_1149586 [Postia placenta MAD-698-R-SB12]EED82369.1 predicted protein [Postia placenta Mad-698-R]KAF9810534.1 hypothetical protein IEO21_06857 [Postia placenta]OSX59995.1 hypothetical protein POSPLADRAFT_1149586 [Postia placenta MAD-698-R-SB12]
MFCLSIFSVVLCALAAAVLASPIDKRVTHTGRGTYYDVGLGACGYNDVDSDAIVAISHEIYGGGGNCNQWMQITNPSTGQVQYGKTRDKCMGCAATAIDMSPSLFESLGVPLGQGVQTVEWHFMSKDWSP